MEQTNGSEKLLAYIESAKAKGAADDFLVGLLREQGWAAEDIYAAFGRYYQTLTGLPVPVRAGGAGEAALGFRFENETSGQKWVRPAAVCGYPESTGV